MLLHIVYEMEEGSSVCRTEVDLPVRWLYRTELEKLMRLAGLRVLSLYGDYDFQPYCESSPRLIVTASNGSEE